MKEYFLLQYRMINRHLRDFGVHPFAGWLLSVSFFTGFSLFLFYKTEYAGYVYLLTAIMIVSRLSDLNRNRFLQGCFAGRTYRLVRLAENGWVVFPFLLFLLVMGQFLNAVVLVFSAALFAITRVSTRIAYALPTPFGRRPFEFAAGFRNTWAFILLNFILTIISVVSGNFNLGIFSLIVVFMISFTYYLNPEDQYFIWIHAMSPGKFLAGKAVTAFLYAALLAAPVILVLSLFYPGNISVILGFTGLGMVYLLAMILAKYASFPQQITLPVMILLAFSVSFPPLLGAIIPFLWIKSVRHLNPILQ